MKKMKFIATGIVAVAVAAIFGFKPADEKECYYYAYCSYDDWSGHSWEDREQAEKDAKAHREFWPEEKGKHKTRIKNTCND